MLTPSQIARARTAAADLCVSLGSLDLMDDYGMDPMLPTVTAEEAEARQHFELVAAAMGYRIERIAPVNREALTAPVVAGAVNLRKQLAGSIEMAEA